MTVFGRDSIITGIQTLLLGPELARSALEELAELQATEDDPAIDAEPGKIVHEVRRGKAYEVVVRALLRHRRRDAALPRPALRGLAVDRRHAARRRRCASRPCGARVDRPLRRPRRRRLRRVREALAARARQPVVEGLARLAALPRRQDRAHADRAVRGAGLRLRREAAHGRDRARGLARPRRSAIGSTARRRSCGERSTTRTGSTSAVATTRSRSTATSSRVDSMCSNMGHLLWSGIVPAERADAVVDQLMGEAMWSGWGVRTMSVDDAAYNPLAYHNGTVWPHDNSLIALGLARYRRWPEAQRIVQRVLEAAAPPRPPAAGGLRRHAADGDAVPDRLSDGRAAAGVGCGDAGAPAPGAARSRSRRASGTRSRLWRRWSCRRGSGRCGCPACCASAGAGPCASTTDRVKVEPE